MLRPLVLSAVLLCLASPALAKERPSTRAQVDYPGFTSLTDDVGAYRQSRLITLDQFQTMSREGDTLILDARSPAAYARGHIEGAINVSFTDFTAPYLAEMIGNPNRRILIYCNNNFSNNAVPVIMKSAPLALNIPTFINLYGYGYRNVYELGDVVDFTDPDVHWVTSAG